MWNLEYELIAILLLAAIIGLLMGRFLCKNGETEERLKKENIIAALKSAKSDLQYSDDKVAEQSILITKQNEIVSQLEEKIVNLNMNLQSSEKQRARLLENIKELEKYKSRFEALSKEFEVQTITIENLKNIKGTNIEEIEGLRTSVKVLKQNKQELEAQEAKLNNELKRREKELNEKLNDTIAELEKLRAYKNDTTVDGERLAFLEKEYAELAQNFNTLIEERDDLLARIRAISSVVGAVGVDNSNS